MSDFILVSGSIAYDLLLGYEGSFAEAIDPKKLDQLSVSFFSSRGHKHYGGTGANISWHLKLLGAKPLLVGAVGADGEDYLLRLESAGIDVSHIDKIDQALTATAVIGTDQSERQIAFFHPGADSYGGSLKGKKMKENILYGIVSARDAQRMLEAIDWIKSNKIPLLFDPGQQVLAFSGDELIRSLQYSAGLITNEYEWKMFSEKTGLSKPEVLRHTGYLIVTLGEKGAELNTKEGTVTIPACKTNRVVNPTGTGDAFRAGLLFGLVKDWPMVDAIKLGAAVASLVVEIEATQLDLLDKNELQARIIGAYHEPLAQMLV